MHPDKHLTKLNDGTLTKEEYENIEKIIGKSLDNNMVQVLKGLSSGEQIVVSGQFLLDSESRLKEAVQKMMDNNFDSSSSNTAEPSDQAENDSFFDDM